MNLSLGRLIKEKDYIFVQLIQQMSEFKLHSPFKPAGDQPQAINELTDGILAGDRFQTLLGITGSGKTRTVASVIEQVQRPTLVMSHNKTLAAQLYLSLIHI